MILKLDMIQTLAISVIVLILGGYIKERVKFFDYFSIPAPVVGGLVFSIFSLILHNTGVLFLELDTSLKDFFMTIFFTAAGFSADIKVLGKYGKRAIGFTIIVALLVTFQNIIGVSLAKFFKINLLYGLNLGSVAMTGGHGTTGGFASIFAEKYGATDAMTVGMAAATFGLITGGLIGGPVGRFLVKIHKLKDSPLNEQTIVSSNNSYNGEEKDEELTAKGMVSATNQIFISMGIGTIIYMLFQKINFTLPSYVGAMLMGAILRNINKIHNPLTEINSMGNISLSIFVSMALMDLRLWELSELALPMIVTLMIQVIFIAIFMILIGYKILGSDYDAAVMVTGCCGFGLGAMPNGVSNMKTFTEKWGESSIAFLIVPGVGSVIIDLVNGGIITIFMNLVTKI